ncbi:MAG TPA: epoxide hydrolase, partial [Kribbella sp.]
VVQAPVGLTFVTYENPPGIHTANERVRAFKTGPQADWFNHVNVNAHGHGGHFIPWENPDAWVSDLRRTFHGRRP